jgi:hypothetical protein
MQGTRTESGGGGDGEMPYSPSQSIEPMDTSQYLDGVRNLFNASALQEEAKLPVPPPDEGTKTGGTTTTDKTATEPPAADPRGADGGGNQDGPADPRGAGDQSEEEDAIAKSKAYIAKIKAQHIAEIKCKIGKDMLAYESIKAHNARDSMSFNIGGDGGVGPAALEGMIEMGERRILAAGLRFDMKAKRVVSSSFNADWTCVQCGAHGTKPAFKIRGEAGTSSGDQAVILSDQCFPPILPTSGTEKCLKILRVENGSVVTLVDEFVKTLGNRIFPAGSIILLASMSHLGRVGLTAYVNDILWAEKELKAKLGRETIVRPLPPLILPWLYRQNIDP